MKKTFLVFALVLVSLFTFAQLKSTGGLDKNTLVHLSVGIGVGNATGVFVTNPKKRVIIGFIGGTIAGLTKEIYDTKQGNQYGQLHDILATGLGGAVGGVMINLAVRNDRRRRASEKYNKCFKL